MKHQMDSMVIRSVNTYLEYYFGIIFIETIGTIPNCETFDFDILQY